MITEPYRHADGRDDRKPHVSLDEGNEQRPYDHGAVKLTPGDEQRWMADPKRDQDRHPQTLFADAQNQARPVADWPDSAGTQIGGGPSFTALIRISRCKSLPAADAGHEQPQGRTESRSPAAPISQVLAPLTPRGLPAL